MTARKFLATIAIAFIAILTVSASASAQDANTVLLDGIVTPIKSGREMAAIIRDRCNNRACFSEAGVISLGYQNVEQRAKLAALAGILHEDVDEKRYTAQAKEQLAKTNKALLSFMETHWVLPGR